jgi:hypothetical protein
VHAVDQHPIWVAGVCHGIGRVNSPFRVDGGAKLEPAPHRRVGDRRPQSLGSDADIDLEDLLHVRALQFVLQVDQPGDPRFGVLGVNRDWDDNWVFYDSRSTCCTPRTGNGCGSSPRRTTPWCNQARQGCRTCGVVQPPPPGRWLRAPRRHRHLRPTRLRGPLDGRRYPRRRSAPGLIPGARRPGIPEPPDHQNRDIDPHRSRTGDRHSQGAGRDGAKTILDDRSVPYDKSDDKPALLKKVRAELELTPREIEAATRGADTAASSTATSVASSRAWPSSATVTSSPASARWVRREWRSWCKLYPPEAAFQISSARRYEPRLARDRVEVGGRRRQVGAGLAVADEQWPTSRGRSGSAQVERPRPLPRSARYHHGRRGRSKALGSRRSRAAKPSGDPGGYPRVDDGQAVAIPGGPVVRDWSAALHRRRAGHCGAGRSARGADADQEDAAGATWMATTQRCLPILRSRRNPACSNVESAPW